jgi:hypothetical protein
MEKEKKILFGKTNFACFETSENEKHVLNPYRVKHPTIWYKNSDLLYFTTATKNRKFINPE